ncbi:MAG: response regulator [Rhodanobacteraceae bacterium]
MLERTTERRLDGDARQGHHWRARVDAPGVVDIIGRGHRRSGHPVSAVDCAHSTPIIFVVDADAAIRKSLEAPLRNAGWRVESFGSAAEFLARARAFAPGCIVLDVASPGNNGLDLLRRLAQERAGMPIVATTADADVPMCVEAMKIGALDFFVKPLVEAALVRSIEHAIERSRTTLREEAQMITLRERQASLSPRERDVMSLVVSGLLNKQIGGELGISEITVKAHRGNVMRKMQADSLACLVTIATRLGLAPVASRSGHRIDHFPQIA